jgi:hypothetical protein
MTRTPLATLAVCLLFAGRAAAQSPAGPPPAPPADPDPAAKYRIEKGLAMFAGIKDDAIFPWADTGPRDLADALTDEMEERAYDEVLRHARQFSTAELEQHARRDLAIKDLYTNGRASYKLDLIFVEGWLKSLRKAEPTKLLRESGVTELYEAWIFPSGGIDPVCVFVTELPPGLTPQAELKQPVDRFVSVGGYFFKLLRYESNQPSKDKLGEHTTRRAPVLMARSLTVKDEPTSAGAAWRQTFLPLVVAGVGAVACAIFGLSWYFRRGDALVRREIDNKLTENPFANG